MASFKNSFVMICEERNLLSTRTTDNKDMSGCFDQSSNEANLIAEITITVKAATSQSDSLAGLQKELAALDPLSQLLWSQTLRQLH